MSMRQQVGQSEIEHFLVQVGRTRPGRLYLVGGAAMVHRGIRSGQTLDIDIQIAVTGGASISIQDCNNRETEHLLIMNYG